MAPPYAGELCAMGTALCWTLGSQCFEAAAMRIGSLSLNLIRMAMAVAFLAVTLSFTRGTPIPLDFPSRAWLWLSLSGIVGFFIGDLCLFRAIVLMGPRIALLVMSLSAPITAVIGQTFLGERYLPRQWLGIIITVAGVAWVAAERHDGADNAVERTGNGRRIRVITAGGILLALGGAIGQAAGYVLSKHGMGALDPFAATQIRAIAGLCAFAILTCVLRRWPKIREAMSDRRAMAFSTAGAFLGPYLGVSLALMALHYTTTGVASTILALVPVFLIPFAIVIHREHVSYRAILGALVAVGGVALLVN